MSADPKPKDTAGIRFSSLNADNPEECEGAAQLCVEQGWNVDGNVVREYHQSFPEGSFIATDGDSIIGYSSSTALNGDHGFICFLVVNENYRGLGIGGKLFTRALEALGERNVCLFTTPDASEIYKKKYKFKECNPSHYVIASRFVPQLKDEEDLVPDVTISTYSEEDFDSLFEYDTAVHTIERKQTLRKYVEKGHCLLAKDKDGNICGYTITERKPLAVKFAPLYADNTNVFKKLLRHAVATLSKDEKMHIFVPFDHTKALDLYKEIGFSMDNCLKVEYLYTKRQVKVPVEKIFSMMNMSTVFA